MEKQKRSKTKRVLIWVLGIVGGLIFMIIIAGYFYWNNLLKVTLEEAVKKETKGLYHAKIGNVYYGVFAGNLYIRNFYLYPDTSVYDTCQPDSVPFMLLSLKVKHFRIDDISLRNVILNNQIIIKRIAVQSPEVTLWRKRIPTKDSTRKSPDTTLSLKLPKGITFLSVGEIQLQEGSFSFIDQTKDTVTGIDVPSISIRITNLLIDSASQADPRIYNADDISITLRNIRQQTGNGMYGIHVGETGFSTAENRFYISQFHLEPLYNRHDFSRKLGYQSDRMDITALKMTLTSVDWRALLLDQKLEAQKLQIDSLVLDDYRDKRVPMRNGFQPPMPQQLVRESKASFRIDSVELVGGKATYSEQVSNELGTIFFDRMNGVLTGLTNDSAWLADKTPSPLKASAYLEGTGKLEATINFIFGDPFNRFTLTATLSTFDLTRINPMLTKLVPAEIVSGTVNKLLIPMITFNDNYSTGELTMYYKNLGFKMVNDDNTTWSGIKTGVINWVAKDFLIHRDNPQKNGKLQSGTVYFQRDKHKSLINFIWKSVFSGLKSSMGFNSKEQKTMKKGKK